MTNEEKKDLLEQATEAVCFLCRRNNAPLAGYERGAWYHYAEGQRVYCYASAIWKMIDELPDDPIEPGQPISTNNDMKQAAGLKFALDTIGGLR
jgi:hypothetical protein